MAYRVVVEQAIGGVWMELITLPCKDTFNFERDSEELLVSFKEIFKKGEFEDYTSLWENGTIVNFCRAHGPLRARLVDIVFC